MVVVLLVVEVTGRWQEAGWWISQWSWLEMGGAVAVGVEAEVESRW